MLSLRYISVWFIFNYINIDFVFVLFAIDSNTFSSKDTSLFQNCIIFVYFTHTHFLLWTVNISFKYNIMSLKKRIRKFKKKK